MSTTETSESAPPIERPPGGWLTTADHKSLGTFCLVVAFAFLLAGGGIAAALRTQMARPDLDLIAHKPYLQLLTLHGTFSFFLFLLPAWFGLGFALVPLQIGAGRLAFPRLCATSVWLFVAGGASLIASAFARGGEAVSGWSMDNPVPLHHVGGRGVDLWILGVGLVCGAVVLGAVNLLSTVAKLRAPGMTWGRVPMFTWSMFVSSAVLLLAVPSLVAGLILLFVEHHLGGRIFDAGAAGDPLVWRTLFWFFAYPALWATVLPALGVVCEIVGVFAGTGLFQRRVAAFAIAGAGALSFAGWGSELAGESGVPKVLFSVTSILLLGAVAQLLLLWLATLALPRRLPRLKAPLLQALGLVSVFGLGLVAMAVMEGAATGRLGHQTYFWVGAWHFVLVGGATFGIVAALFYWAPKLWGRHLSAGLGGLQLLLLVVGVDLTFAPMLVLGGQGLPRRATSFSASSLGPANFISTIGAYVLSLAVLLVLVNLLVSVAAKRGKVATDDPWEADTLEWATSSPPPPHNFDVLPDVRSDRPLADLRNAGPAEPPQDEPEAPEPAPAGATV